MILAVLSGTALAPSFQVLTQRWTQRPLLTPTACPQWAADGNKLCTFSRRPQDTATHKTNVNTFRVCSHRDTATKVWDPSTAHPWELSTNCWGGDWTISSLSPLQPRFHAILPSATSLLISYCPELTDGQSRGVQKEGQAHATCHTLWRRAPPCYWHPLFWPPHNANGCGQRK